MEEYQLVNEDKVLATASSEPELMKKAQDLVQLGVIYTINKIQSVVVGEICLQLVKTDKKDTPVRTRKRRTSEELIAAGEKSRSKTIDEAAVAEVAKTHNLNKEDVKKDIKEVHEKAKPELTNTPADILDDNEQEEEEEDSFDNSEIATDDGDDLDEFNDAPEVEDEDEFSTDDAIKASVEDDDEGFLDS